MPRSIGAFAFAFAPYHAAQLSHIQTEAMFFMPLALAGLHRYWMTGRAGRWLILLAVSTALNALACGYFLLYLQRVCLGIALVWLAISSRRFEESSRAVLVALVLRRPGARAGDPACIGRCASELALVSGQPERS